MIHVEIDVSKHYTLRQVDKDEEGAIELPTGDWVVREKVDEPTIQNVVMRESGLEQYMEANDCSLAQAVIAQVDAAYPVYSDRADWITVRCPDPELEAQLHLWYGLAKESNED